MKGPDPKPENDQRNRIRVCVTLALTGYADMKYWPPVAYRKTPNDTVPRSSIGNNTTSFQ